MFESAIGCVCTASGAIVGTAFATYPAGRIVTCAHVVADALEMERTAASAIGQEVTVRFPYSGREGRARVVAWSPLGEMDVAVLESPDVVAGDDRLRPLPLYGLEQRHRRAFRTYGFPRGYDSGRAAYGVFLQSLVNDLAQFEGPDITYGFSGSPVQDVATGHVIGIVTSVDPAIGQTFVIPGSILRKVCPDLEVISTHGPFDHLTRGLAGLPGDPLSSVEAFLQEYLGTPELQVPFGGRADVYRDLDAWLADPESPRAIVSVPAGRGKSAILTRWSSELAATNRARVVFIPVSLRFQTSLRSTFLRIWGGRLDFLKGTPVSNADILRDPDAWLGEIGNQMREDRAPDEPPLLVVFDGFDEASDWQPGRHVRFPTKLGRGVKFLASARTLAEDRGPADWVKRLGWPVSTRAIELPQLDRAGLADVLHAMGDPLAGLHSDVDVVGRLHVLTEGEPFLIRLYVDALVGVGERAAFIKPAELARIEPGLQGFFDGWWMDQRDQWREQGLDVEGTERSVQSLLYTLACAEGPLDSNDIAQVAPPDAGLDDRPTLKQVSAWIARFIVSDRETSGYVLSHPRLTQYFRDIVRARHDYGRWAGRFVAYGHSTLDRLRRGEIKKAPRYVLQHFTTHLDRQGAPAADYLPLLDNHWRLAWGTSYHGFLRDVDKCYEALGREIDEAVEMGARPRYPGPQLFCILCHASITSLIQNFPGRLLRALVEHDVLKPVQALGYIERLTNEDDRDAAVLAMAEFAPPGMLVEAFDRRTADIATLSSRDVESGQRYAVDERRGEPQRRRVDDLVRAARWVHAERRADALEKLRRAPHSMETLRARIGLSAIASPSLAGEALAPEKTDARELLARQRVSEPLAMLLPLLPPDERRDAINEILAAATPDTSPTFRLRILGPVFRRLEQSREWLLASELRRELIHQGAGERDLVRLYAGLSVGTLAKLRTHLDSDLLPPEKTALAMRLGAEAPEFLREEVLRQFLSVPQSPEESYASAAEPFAYLDLLPLAAGDPAAGRELVDRAFGATQRISDVDEFSDAVTAILPFLADDTRRALASEVARIVQRYSSAEKRAERCQPLLPLLDGEVLKETLDTQRTVFGCLDPADRMLVEVLEARAEGRLSEGERHALWAKTRRILDPGERMAAYASLAAGFEVDKRHALGQVLSQLSEVSPSHSRWIETALSVLPDVSGQLRTSILERLKGEILPIRSARNAGDLARLLAHLPDDASRRELLERAAATMGDPGPPGVGTALALLTERITPGEIYTHLLSSQGTREVFMWTVGVLGPFAGSKLPMAALAQVWADWLKTVRQVPRGGVFVAFAEICPFLNAFGAEGATAEAAQLLRRAVTWWP